MNYSYSKIIFRLVICFVFILSFFSLTNSASAAYQYVYAGPNGNIITDVNLIPGADPFIYAPGAQFQATAQIVSFSTAPETINLTAQNNLGAVATLIPQTILPAGGFITPQYINFQAPSTSGSYAVKFVTGVDETQQPQVPTITGVSIYSVCYNNNDCDIQGDVSLDVPARVNGESIDITYKYKLCSTSGGCNPNVETSQTGVTLYAGQDSIHFGVMGTPGSEPQIYGYCVSNATVTIPQGMECQ